MHKRKLSGKGSEFYYKILLSSNSPIVITDALAPDQPIIFVNRAFESVTGYEAAECIGRNCRFLQGDDRDQPARGILADALRDGMSCECLLKNYRKDGSMFWNQLYVFPVSGGHGIPVNFVGIQHDVTAEISMRLALEDQRTQLACMHEAAQATNLSLEQERGRLAEALQHLRQLSRQLVDAQEHERKHLARELHDELGQRLTALNFGLHAIRPASAEPRLHGAWRQAVTDVEWLIAQVRNLSALLRPPQLDFFPLDVVVRQMVERHFAGTGIECRLETAPIGGPLPERISIAAYRMIQESVTNVLRHAGASRVTVRLSQVNNDAALELAVCDDGRGFQPEAVGACATAASGSGLAGIRERVTLLGGTLMIDSAPGRGTRLVARLPIEVAGDGA